MGSKGGRRRRRRITAKTLVRTLACALVAAYIGWWAVATAAVDTYARRNPFAAAVVAPDDPRVKLSMALTEFSLRGGRVAPENRAAATAALGRSALAFEPFLLNGVQAIADGDTARGERLLAEARRRNPRSRITRLLLLDRYLRSNRVDDAGAEIAVLGRLILRAPEVLAPELARFARDPKLGPSAGAMLAREPQLRDAVLARLAADGAPLETILDIAGKGPPSPPGADWQRLVVGRLINGGKVAEAYRYWLRFGRLEPTAGGKGLYDARFEGLPGSPPFNWDLTSGGEGVAERAKGPALRIDYYGRANVTLARQLMMLAPGRYRLALRVEGDARGESSRLGLSVACLDRPEPLLSLPLRDIGSTPRSFSGRFTVPAGCAAQWISFDGAAGDVPSQESVTVTGLGIGPEGGR